MELQDAWPTLQQMGFALVAISYDDVATLAAFAERHAITYPLLSDTGSERIRSLGLLNEHLEQQQAAYGRPVRPEQHGVPYPGTFVLDEHGLVRTSISNRATAYGQRGASSWSGPARVARHSPKPHRRRCTTRLRSMPGPTSRPIARISNFGCTCAVALPAGVHMYAAPVPPGYQALTVELEQVDGLDVGVLALPPARPFTVTGLDESFLAYEGTVHGTLPFVLTQNLGPTTIEVRLRYQSCTATSACHPLPFLERSFSMAWISFVVDWRQG